jgi:hypothetical protein
LAPTAAERGEPEKPQKTARGRCADPRTESAQLDEGLFDDAGLSLLERER